MNKNLTFAVVGGDMRQIFLAKQLCLDGHDVFSFGIDRFSFKEDIKPISIADFSKADIIILPMPVQREKGVLNAPLCNTSYKLDLIINSIPSKKIVFVGGVTEDIKNQAKRNEILLYDYLGREELAVLNAIPTCEGALELAMRELLITLHGAKVLVIGNGRIGRMLSDDLSALHAKVTVSARSPKDFAWITSKGLSYLNTNDLIGKLSDFDLIINTVPALVLGVGELRSINESCLIIDLASNAGGVDFDYAEKIGIRAIHALSLPGKVAPISAATAIKSTIYTILQEEKVL